MPLNPRVFYTNKLLIAVFSVAVLIAVFLLFKAYLTHFGERTDEFSKGVLAVNPSRFVYVPGDVVEIGMASLDSKGDTVCNSNLVMTITAPSGKKAELTSRSGSIQPSTTCSPDNNVTNDPDYRASYAPLETGDYKLEVINKDTGKKVENKFSVRQGEMFYITRTGATRLNPSKADRYPMTITVTPKEDFTGQVVEYIPASFNIIWQGQAKVETIGEYKTLTWDVDLRAGATKELIYEYLSPQISPEFYTIGSLKILKDNSQIYDEVRSWQIANDATRFYLPSTGSAPVSPAWYSSGGVWNNTTTASPSKLKAVTSKISSSDATKSITDADVTALDFAMGMWVSAPLAAQTISAQTVGLSIKVSESAAGNNLFVKWVIRVLKPDGTFEATAPVAYRADATEVPLTASIASRYDSVTSNAITVTAGSRLVIEVGLGGDPSGAGSHTGTLIIGDNNGSDLDAADADTAGDPWINFATDTLTFMNEPPTNVSATDGTYTDKVTITWTKPTGATGYKVYEGANLLQTLGDVATYDDTAAPAPSITAGTASASDGTSTTHVVLSISGESANAGSARTYSVKATYSSGGDSPSSYSDSGNRGVGTLTYQWQRSAGDSDASYSDISGATTDPYNDTGAPQDGSGRYYKCYFTATGATSAYTTADRGYRQASINLSGTMYQTDESTSYQCATNNEQLSYTVGTYSVTDSNTGLIWQKYGHGSSDGYTVPTSSANCSTSGNYIAGYCTYQWQDALKYCANLNMDGQTDWRLPNAKELHSIVEFDASDPCIDTTSFLNNTTQYWTSTTLFNDMTKARYIHISEGNLGNDNKSGGIYKGARCVRGNAGSSFPDTGQTSCYNATTTTACSDVNFPDQDADYTNNAPSYSAGTNTVTDNITGLIWQRYGHGSSNGYTVPTSVSDCAAGGTYSSSYCTYTWQNALKYCSNLTLDEQTDWRLPSAKELLTVANYGVTSPTLDTTNFLNTQNSIYWGSTTNTYIFGASVINYPDGNLAGTNKAGSYYVRCVRGNPGTAVPDTGQVSCYDATTISTCGNENFPGQDADYIFNTGLDITARVNNTTSYTARCVTDNGAWQVNNVPVSSGDKVMIYATANVYKGSTVLVTDNTSQTDIPLIQNRVVLRDDVNGSITNSEVLSANTADTDDLVTTTGTDVNVATDKEIHVYTGDTYAPGANVTAGKLHMVGSYYGSTETLALTGSGTGTSRPLYINGGTFTAPATTVFSGTSDTSIDSATYNALSFTPTITGNIAYTMLGAETINGNFNINPTSSGANTLTVNLGGTTTVDAGYTTTITGTTSGLSALDTVDGSNYALSSGKINIAAAGTLNARASDITLTSTTSTPFSRTGTFNPGTSNLIFSQTGGDTTLTSGTLSCYDMEVNMSGRTGTLGNTLSSTGTVTVTAGTLDTSASNFQIDAKNVTISTSGTLKPNASTINLTGNWSNTGAYTYGTSTVNLKPLETVNNSMVDNNTGLIWQKHGHGSSDGYTAPTSVSNCASGGTFFMGYCSYSWQNALKYCASLNMDGQTDWRLPNARELQSLVKYGTASPSIETTKFLNTPNFDHWTSTSNYFTPSESWAVSYSTGAVISVTKVTNSKVRCVRGSAGSSFPDTGQSSCYDNTTTLPSCSSGDTSEFPRQDGVYTINAPSYTAGTYATTDNNTGLIWQKNGNGASNGYTAPTSQTDCNATSGTYAAGPPASCTYSWQNALKYCANLSLDDGTGTKTDWRVPNAKEIQSIINYGTYNPAIDTVSFLNTTSTTYRSSTTYATSTNLSFSANLLYGSVATNNKTNSYNVRCIRGSAGSSFPDTGQTSCYNDTTTITCTDANFPDQDGDYTINSLNYGTYSDPNHQVSGNTTFYNLSTTQTPQTITFVHDSVTGIADNGALTLNGAAGMLLTLQSDGNIEWYLRVSPVGTTVNVSYVNVSQSNAGGYKQINASNGTSTDGGNNINWLFNPSTVVYTNFQSVSMSGVDVNSPYCSQLSACGNTFTCAHNTSLGVAPENKVVTYGTVSSTLGGTGAKCWITKNLGASTQASSVSDDTEASAGWYWQFNRKQGYKNDGSNVTPLWTITGIDESTDWTAANDPCTLELGTGWRIPTYTEWFNADASGGWNSDANAYSSVLKLHDAGYLDKTNGAVGGRGGESRYWSSTQSTATVGNSLIFAPGGSYMNTSDKAYGFSIRCLKD